MSEEDDRVGTVVLTALDLEYDAVRKYLTDLRTRTHSAGTLFETGIIRGTSVRIALAVVGAGSRAAAVLVERANALFRPDAVFFVGVAGALHTDIDLGDVVVATRVYGYHGGKEEAAKFLARPRAWDAPHHLDQRARHLARTAWWGQLLPDRTGQESFKIHFRPVAAGEVVLNSRTGTVAELIRRHYNDVAAIEMESAGAAEAAHLNRALPMLTIRGISDRADGRKLAADAAGSQPVAAAHAAVFALTLATTISTDPSPEISSPTTAVVATTPPHLIDTTRSSTSRSSRRRLLIATGVVGLAGAGAIGLARHVGTVGAGSTTANGPSATGSARLDGGLPGRGGSASPTHRAAAGTQIRTLTDADRVLAVAYSPPRLGLVASAGVDSTVRLWRADTGANVRNLSGHDRWVGAIAYSPNGAQLATASGDRTLRVWHADTGDLVHRLDHPDEVFSVAYAPNSAQLATACIDGTVRVWDAGAGALIRPMPGHGGGACAVAYSPDSAELATASRDGQVYVWRADNGALLRSLPGHNGPVALAYSPNSVQLATVGNDQTVRMWRAGTSTLIRSFTGHADAVYSVSYAPDSAQFATASQDRSAKIWRADSGEGIRTIPHSSPVRCVAYSPEGSQLATAVDNNTVQIWAT